MAFIRSFTSRDHCQVGEKPVIGARFSLQGLVGVLHALYTATLYRLVQRGGAFTSLIVRTIGIRDGSDLT